MIVSLVHFTKVGQLYLKNLIFKLSLLFKAENFISPARKYSSNSNSC